jgi:serine protease Do
MKISLRLSSIFILFIFSLACVRQSGQKSATSKNHTTPSYIDKNERVNQVAKSSNEVHKSNTSKKLTGTEIFSKYNEAVFMVFTSDGQVVYQGSGFFVTGSGIGVSNYHVFDGTTIGFEVIKLVNKKTYKIKEILAKSREDDYLIFQVESHGTKFNYIPIEFSVPQVGEKVYAIGSPRGLENTFSSGEISQVRKNNLIQISVPIDHGSSGGALINEQGYVIGITTGGYDDSAASLNFAIDINVLVPYFN